MGVTHEEAIRIIEKEIHIDVRCCTHEDACRFEDALRMAISALREQEERSKGCYFCWKFDFKTVAPEIDKYGARLLLATSDCVFPNNRQFKFCPVCGRRLEEV